MPLASALAGGPISFINADVALDGEPVVGSFTVDGLTFAVAEGSNVELVGVSEAAGALSRRVVAESQGLSAPDAPTGLGAASAASSAEADDTVISLPESVSFEGADYALTSIAPYAFYLSGVTSVELPASVIEIDDRAFRSSDVSSVEVAEDNPSYTSFDGILYDADHSSLLLIPGGRTGAARISDKAEEVDAAAFSHCAGVTAISVDAGSDHLSSWDGLLYDASGTTLIRVPAGATDITIREGCTTIAAGALEGCASLVSINATASVTTVSPDVFASIPTVSLLAASLSGAGDPGAAGEPSAQDAAPQLTALVALSSTDDDLPEVDSSAIEVRLPEGADAAPWQQAGFTINDEALDAQADSTDDSSPNAPVAAMQSASVSRAPVSGTVHLYSAEDPLDRVNFMWLKQNADGTLEYAGGNNLGDGYDYAVATSFGFNASGFFMNYKSGLHCYYLAVVPDMGPWGGGDGYVAAHQSLSDYTLYDIAYYYWGGNPSVKYDRHSTTSYESYGTAGQGYDFYLTPGKAKTVTWNGNQNRVDSGKTNTSSVSYVGSGRTCSAPAISSSDYPAGYGSYSWYSSTSGGSYICGASGTSPSVTSDRTYYARWTKKASYKVTLDGNDATSSGTTAVYYWPDKGYTTSSSSTTVVKAGEKLLGTLPIRSGYDFKGYYSSKLSSATQYVDADGNLTSNAQALKAAATWHAQWIKKSSYKVTLDGNGATSSGTTAVYYWPDKGYTTSSSSTTVVEPGKKLLSTLPTRSDYGFEGYYNSTASNAVQCIDPEGNLTADAPSLTEASTWHARWKRTHVTITWDPNGEGATVTPTSSKLECGAVGLPLPLPVRPGYDYAYWHTDPSSYTPVWSDSVVPSIDTTYYAHWTKKDSLSIDLDGNEATGAGTSEIYYWPERGYTNSENSTAVIEPGSLVIASLPSRTGYTFKGYYSSTTSTTQYIDSNGRLTSNAPALSASATWYAQWEKKASHKVTLNGNGATSSGTTAVYYWPDRGYTTSSSSTTVVKAGEKLLGTLPIRSGYDFKGYYSSTSPSATRYIDAAGCLTTAAPALSASTTWYAQWVELGSLTWYSAEDPTRTDAFSWLASSGNAATGSGGGNRLGASANALWPVERTSWGFMVSNRFYLTPGSYSEGKPNLSDYVLYDIAYYRKADGAVVEPAVGWKQEGTQGALEVYLTPGTPRKVFWDAGEGSVDKDMSWIGDGRGCTSPVPVREGYLCTGWWTEPEGGDKAATPGEDTAPITQDTTLYARWTPKVAAVAPVSAEVRLDILGIDEQETVEGKEGYVESRCVAPIKVASVAFDPLPGAAELFGSGDAGSVSLDAFADGAEQPCFSFPLSTPDTLEAAASDEAAQALMPFRMEAHGDRVYVVYRFGMPEDLREGILAAIDSARFEGATTPVCSVAYTVALA